jgi:hypothetical protein
MSREILPYPVEVELNTSNINIDSITRDGNKTFWPETKSSADKFLAVDANSNLVWATPAGAGNVYADTGFIGENCIIVTDIADGTRNIKDTSIQITNGNIINANLLGSASNNLLLSGGTMTGSIILSNGTLNAPSLSFTSSANTGFASITPSVISAVSGGAQIMSISSSGIAPLRLLDSTIGGGQSNQCIGTNSFNSSTSSAVNNIAIGTNALASCTNGTNNTAIGYNSGLGSTPLTTGTNNIYIGSGSYPSANNTSNEVVIGSGNGKGSNTVNLVGVSGCFYSIASLSMWVCSVFSGNVCVFTANTNTGFTNRNAPSSTNSGFTNWVYTGIYEITFSGSLYNTGHGTFVENIALNGTPVISTTIDDSKGGEDYYTFNISSFVGINSLTDVVSCTTTGLTTSLPNLLHCSIKYLGT